jgi:Mrp family chromosome partitioning ATPase
LSETRVLANASDGVLLVVNQHRLKRGQLERTADLWEQAGVPVLGLALNQELDRSAAVAYDSYRGPGVLPDERGRPKSGQMGADVLGPPRQVDVVSADG